MPKQKFNVDVPSATEDEALELMVHHLSLASSYFEVVKSDDSASLDEIKRLMDFSPHALTAALLWFETMNKLYKEDEL